MKSLGKYFSILILLMFAMTLFFAVQKNDIPKNQLSHRYVVENGYHDTSSQNLVTGIYLDYRLFDSFFEAAVLLVAVTGVAFIAIKDEDLY